MNSAQASAVGLLGPGWRAAPQRGAVPGALPSSGQCPGHGGVRHGPAPLPGDGHQLGAPVAMDKGMTRPAWIWPRRSVPLRPSCGPDGRTGTAPARDTAPAWCPNRAQRPAPPLPTSSGRAGTPAQTAAQFSRHGVKLAALIRTALFASRPRWAGKAPGTLWPLSAAGAARHSLAPRPGGQG